MTPIFTCSIYMVFLSLPVHSNLLNYIINLKFLFILFVCLDIYIQLKVIKFSPLYCTAGLTI